MVVSVVGIFDDARFIVLVQDLGCFTVREGLSVVVPIENYTK